MLHKFVSGDDATRNRMVKLVPLPMAGVYLSLPRVFNAAQRCWEANRSRRASWLGIMLLRGRCAVDIWSINNQRL